MMERLCGIDIGTTNLKVVLMDEAGACLWSRAIPTPRVPFREGVATDAEALLATVEALVIEAWRATGAGPALRAIAATGVGEDGIGLDAQLRPTGPALPWFDARAAREAEELARHPAADARIGLPIGPDRTVAKWLWLRRHAPEHLADATHWVALTDYPATRWSGTPFMSRTLAARTAAYDVFAREWVGELLAAAGAPLLPPVCDAGTVIGTVAGGALRASGAADSKTLLVAGGHDHPVAAAAIRRSDPLARIDSLGTANVVYGETGLVRAPALHPPLALSVPVIAGPGLACLGVFELAAHIAPDVATRAALDDALAAARLTGGPLAGGFLRHRLEEASLAARTMFRAMDALGVPAGPIYATGGWSRSRAFMELRASVFGCPLHVVDEPELTALGAALLAADGAGLRIGFDARARLATVKPLAGWADACLLPPASE
ncbi:xylulokinase [Angulomicrobium tetraedrale]|uniref:Xylulokinase n=1 Tax=Ancylobacter tetraedralis TaxID=217068 RepID=A0A839ZA54_9HYPH|nr:FGGY family carbohydrate kinase [Ancylobacter tetraedralis]MBB3771623.1 xylulokinase [Ancylobacter tetraedralis]